MSTVLVQPGALALENPDLVPQYVAALHDVRASRTQDRVGRSESMKLAIERKFGSAPPLTAERRDRISLLLSGVDR